MAVDGDQTEIDDRFPTGEWVGFFVQTDSRRRYRMDLFLEFAGQKISGCGQDLIAEFSISGDYDPSSGKCSLSKQYLRRHEVIYIGLASSGGIVGEWRVPGNPASWTGPFFIWPRALGDLASEFETAFLEFELSGRLADAPPELVGA